MEPDWKKAGYNNEEAEVASLMYSKLLGETRMERLVRQYNDPHFLQAKMQYELEEAKAELRNEIMIKQYELDRKYRD